MRRGRAPSRELSGPGGPQWDDPNGQLPGTRIPGDTGDSLYRSSSLRRRRDASPVARTVESVGQEGVGVVPERPSLFSTSGSSSFNPFSAALSSLRPEERAEVNQTGVSDALQRYANQEMRRLFAEHLRSLPQEPISSSFDLFGLSSRGVSAGETAQGSGVAGGTSQVYHIGTPSGSENTGSSLFQSIPSQRQTRYVFAYGMDNSDRPCYLLWPIRGGNGQFLLVDPWSGNYFDLEAAKFVKPIGIEHFFDAFSLEKKRPLKIDAASALNIQVNDVSDSLVVNHDKAARFELTPVWAPAEPPAKRAKTAEVRLSSTSNVPRPPKSDENENGSSEEEDSDSSGSNSDVSSQDDSSDVSDLRSVH